MSARFLVVCLVPAALLVGAFAPAAAESPSPAGGRPQDQMVAVEVRFISINEDSFERIGVDFNARDPKAIVEDGSAVRSTLDAAPGLLNERQVRKLLEAIQGDVRTNIMQAPKLTVADGKSATLRCTEQKKFVTGIDLSRQGEQVVFRPKTETITTGLTLSVRPDVTAGGRAVKLKLDAKLTSLDPGEVPLFPIVVPITPMEDGHPGKPVVFTQFLQQPRVSTLAVDRELTLPDGGTMLMSGWKRLREVRHESGPPVLSKVPYANRLFRNVGYGRESETLLVLVTARIITPLEKEVRKTGSVPKKKRPS